MATGSGKISELEKIGQVTEGTIFEMAGEAPDGQGLDNFHGTAAQIEGFIIREEGKVRAAINETEDALNRRQDGLGEAIAAEEERARAAEGDLESLETFDRSSLAAAINTVKRGEHANAQQITKLESRQGKLEDDLEKAVEKAESELREAAEKTENDLEEAKEELKDYTDEARLANHSWLPAVQKKAGLPVSGLKKTVNYLCRVISDKSGSGVYQAIAGWEDAPEWTYFSDNADWIDDEELEQAISGHNENAEAHADIREAIGTELENHDMGESSHADIREKIDSEAGTREAKDRELGEAIETETNVREEAVRDLQEQISGLSPEVFENIPALLLNSIYPAGTVYMSVQNISPAVFLGGTWTVWGAGRAPVGVAASGTFNAVEKTGGEEHHQLSESEMPRHNHYIGCGAAAGGTSSHRDAVGYGSSLYGWGVYLSEYSGSFSAHNNLQPYITCYMFKRTA